MNIILDIRMFKAGIVHSQDMNFCLFLPSTAAIIQPKHTCFPTADWPVGGL